MTGKKKEIQDKTRTRQVVNVALDSYLRIGFEWSKQKKRTLVLLLRVDFCNREIPIYFLYIFPFVME